MHFSRCIKRAYFAYDYDRLPDLVIFTHYCFRVRNKRVTRVTSGKGHCEKDLLIRKCTT